MPVPHHSIYYLCWMLFLLPIQQQQSNEGTFCNKPDKTLYVYTLLLLLPFYDPLSGTTQVSQYQKDKPFWILLKQA